MITKKLFIFISTIYVAIVFDKQFLFTKLSFIIRLEMSF